MQTSIEVILNDQAGNGHAKTGPDAVMSEFTRQGATVTVFTAKQGGLTELARQRAKGPAKVVVAGGGDGTIASVAAALLGTDKVLGVLPLGTLNHFSKDLHIPQDLAGAVAVVLGGRVERIDVGDVNGRMFLNNSSLGVYPIVVADRVAQQRKLGRGKWRAFAAAILHLLRRYPRLILHLTIDGKKLSRQSPFLFVGNNPYELAGFDLGARRSLTGGQLGVYLTTRTGRFDLFWLLTRALFNRLEASRDFESFRATEARIETRGRELLVAADGEVVRMKGPLYYQIRPAALAVLVPADGEGRK